MECLRGVYYTNAEETKINIFLNAKAKDCTVYCHTVLQGYGSHRRVGSTYITNPRKRTHDWLGTLTKGMVSKLSKPPQPRCWTDLSLSEAVRGHLVSTTVIGAPLCLYCSTTVFWAE